MIAEKAADLIRSGSAARTRRGCVMQVLDQSTTALVRTLCELIVPGCERVGGEVYVDALLARMPDDARAGAVRRSSRCAPPRRRQRGAGRAPVHGRVSDGPRAGLRGVLQRLHRSGRVGPGAWEEIDFSSPLASGSRRIGPTWGDG